MWGIVVVGSATLAVATSSDSESADPFGYGDLRRLLSSNTPSTRVLPGLQLVASTNVCWSKTEKLFRTDAVQDLCAALPSHVAFVEEHRAFERPKPGIVLPAANGSVRETRTLPLQKTFVGYGDLQYCWNIRSNRKVDTTNFTRVHGVAVLLTEHHGNSNIGHASRDASFLANLLHHAETSPESLPPLRQVIVKDNQYKHMVRQGKRVMRYRQDSLTALTRGVLPRDSVAFLGDQEADESLTRLQGQGDGVCFDVAVQRLRSWYFDDGVYRRKAWEFCGVPEGQTVDSILLEEHETTRVWEEREKLAEFIASHPISRGFSVLLGSFGRTSFCDQVRIFARTKVAILHHGAGVFNCAFLPPEGVCIEIESACPTSGLCLDAISGTMSRQFFAVSGIRYVGARLGMPVNRKDGRCPKDKNYYYDVNCAVRVDHAKLTKVLDAAYRIGGPWPDKNASLGVQDHASFWPSAYMDLRTEPLTQVTPSTFPSAVPVAAPVQSVLGIVAQMPGVDSWTELLLVVSLSCIGQLALCLHHRWAMPQRFRNSKYRIGI